MYSLPALRRQGDVLATDSRGGSYFSGLNIGPITGTLTLTKSGSTPRTITIPDAAGTVGLLEVANSWTGANTWTTSGSTQTIRTSSTTNANGALSVRNDRNSGSYDLQFSVPGSAFTGYGLVAADTAVLYSVRSLRLVSDSASGEIVLGVGATGGSRVLTCLNGAAYFGTDPGGSELLRVGGATRINGGLVLSNTGATLDMPAAGVLTSSITYGIWAKSSVGLAIRSANSGRIDFDDSTGAVYLRIGTNLLGFFAASGTSKQTVTGSRGGNAALASLLTALANYGLVTDSTTA
jgi:hypothetical protein